LEGSDPPITSPGGIELQRMNAEHFELSGGKIHPVTKHTRGTLPDEVPQLYTPVTSGGTPGRFVISIEWPGAGEFSLFHPGHPKVIPVEVHHDLKMYLQILVHHE